MTALAHLPAAYLAKQVHRVPNTTTVARQDFILRQAVGRIVLDIGASGTLHDALVRVSAKCYGLDRDGRAGVTACDLDATGPLPTFPGVQLVVCGETLEHLSNPGHLLTRLKAQYPVTTIITVPNAHSDRGRNWLEKGIENCNKEHCCYYSWMTLTTLVERHGYTVKGFYWYNGRPLFAEGMICVCA